jgi:hypothetical protein
MHGCQLLLQLLCVSLLCLHNIKQLHVCAMAHSCPGVAGGCLHDQDRQLVCKKPCDSQPKSQLLTHGELGLLDTCSYCWYTHLRHDLAVAEGYMPCAHSRGLHCPSVLCCCCCKRCHCCHAASLCVLGCAATCLQPYLQHARHLLI